MLKSFLIIDINTLLLWRITKQLIMHTHCNFTPTELGYTLSALVGTIMDKSSVPFWLGGEPIWNVGSIRDNAPFPNEPIAVVHQCLRNIVIGSLEKEVILLIVKRFKLVHLLTGMRRNSFPWLYTRTKKCTTFMLLSIFLKWFCQMLFGQYRVKFFHNILGILIFLRYQEKFLLYTAQKASGKTISEICLVA